MADEQTNTYQAALKKARDSYRRVSSRLYEISREERSLKEESLRLKRTITALAAMCSESPDVDKLGITDACMEALEIFTWPVATSDVLIALDSLGFDMESQKNAAASVHAVLTRLAKSGKIKKIESDGVVKWLGPNAKEEVEGAEITDEDIPF